MMSGSAPTRKAVFEQADQGEALIIIPAIALAEALYLAEKGRVKIRAKEVLGLVENALNYRLYPLDLPILQTAWALKGMPEIHDRVIVATAKRLGLGLITEDSKIRRSGYVQTLW